MKYRSQTMDIVSYSNGTPVYAMALSNDSDVIAISANTGAPLGDLPSITVQTFYGNEEKTDGEVTISAIGCKPATLSGRIYQMESLGEANTGSITFTWKPNGAGTTPVLTKTFTFNVITSNADYDLIIPQTVFNTKNNNVTVSVNVLKKAEGSPATTIAPNGDNNIIVQYKQANENSWTSIKSSSVELEDVTASYTFRIIKAVDEDEENPFVWDSETVEFVSDGAAERDFNITASSYVLVKNADGMLKGSTITLTAHPINLPYQNENIHWYEDDVLVSEVTGLVYENIKHTGKYTAKIWDEEGQLTDWQDSVVIGETQDGATGKDAISITLSNPTMTFHKNTSQAPEFCQVIVYEGGTELNPVEYDNTTQKLKGRGFCIQSPSNCNIVEDKDGVEVPDQDSNGTATFAVLIQASDGIETSRDFTINWVVVENGKNSTVPGPSTTANTQYVYLKTNAQTVDTPTNGTNPEDDSNGWSSDDIYGDVNERYVYRAEVTTIIQTNNGTETSRNYKWSAPMLYKAYNDKGQTQTSYADYLRLTSFGTATNYYYDNNGELIIQANTLAVGEEGAHKFYASEQADIVTIGGWSVDEHCIYQMKTKSRTIISDNGMTINEVYYFDGENYQLPVYIQNDIQYFILKDSGEYTPISYFEKHSQSGQITIIEPQLVGEDNHCTYFAICAIGTGLQEPNSGEAALSVGFTNWDDWSTGNCYITHDGYLHAKNATIQGNIDATSGKIGGWDITKEGIYRYYLDTANETPYEVMINGVLNPDKPEISHSTCFEIQENNDPVFYVRPNGFLYASNAQINGQFYSEGIRKNKIVWSKIENGEFRQQGTSTNIVISGSQIISTGREMTYSNGNLDTADYGEYQSYYLPWQLDFRYRNKGETSFTRAGGIRIGLQGIPDDDSGWEDSCSFFGNWDFPNTASATSTDSDLNLKKEIYYLSKENNKYELLFNSLKPATYQYINGNQGRTHQGFIAQDVLLSLEKAQLTLQDFAALCKRSQEDGGYWGIRYEEFISLNTWQIQLLKPRLTAAEEKIAQLETEVSTLKQELENLKNPQNSDII